MSKSVASYGSWKSPITSSVLTSAGVGLSQLEFTSHGLYWTESRPMEGGRVVIVRHSQGANSDVTPAGFNVRTRVHEYGGGAYTTHEDKVFFSNFSDQLLYGQSLSSPDPLPLGEGLGTIAFRYADSRVSPDGKSIVCVREGHGQTREPINELAIISVDGSHPERSLTSTLPHHDFYAAPRFSPDGRRLCWFTWDHPNMPWDGSDLWTADFDSVHGLSNVRHIAGSPNESVVHPSWSPEGNLHFVSDRSGWWNLYTLRNDDVVPLAPSPAEFGIPHWVFGTSRYAYLSQQRIVCIVSKNGLDYLAILFHDGRLEPIDLPFTALADVQTDGENRIFVIAASASVAPQIISLDVSQRRIEVLKSSTTVEFDRGDISVPEPIEFPTTGGRTAFGLFYRPANRSFAGPSSEKPILLVFIHGGPTSSAGSSLKLGVQYWTTRGFAVVDVNYGGSTGYGREYRERLNGSWGVVDVDDCINAARYLADRGDVDPRRMAIRGGSAGGYTTLSALVFHSVFAAGASHFGVADLTALAADTHKFESRYLDRLVGPYPEAEKIYRSRSPIHFADQLSCPVILFQGGEDKVVPPGQAETFVEALRAKKLPFAYILFPEEGHGFRQAANIQRAAEAELYFYSRVFGFNLADSVEPIEIENL